MSQGPLQRLVLCQPNEQRKGVDVLNGPLALERLLLAVPLAFSPEV